jgi:hypothetical protein
MDEQRSRRTLWMWVGGVIFGGYRLYAFGFSRGAAAVDGEAPVELPDIPFMPSRGTMPTRGMMPYRTGRFPILGGIIGLFLIGGLFRHLVWGVRGVRARRYAGCGWDAPGHSGENGPKADSEASV